MTDSDDWTDEDSDDIGYDTASGVGDPDFSDQEQETLDLTDSDDINYSREGDNDLNFPDPDQETPEDDPAVHHAVSSLRPGFLR
jgi:hypothetical protein